MLASPSTVTQASADLASEARDLLAHALREEVATAGQLIMEAIGSSMLPTVPGGSVLHVDPLTGVPELEELIAFVPSRGPLLCCHRVVALERDGFVRTQGDRSGCRDEPVSLARLVGVVRSFTLGGRVYRVAPGMQPPRPSRYRAQRQRLARFWRRVHAA